MVALGLALLSPRLSARNAVITMPIRRKGSQRGRALGEVGLPGVFPAPLSWFLSAFLSRSPNLGDLRLKDGGFIAMGGAPRNKDALHQVLDWSPIVRTGRDLFVVGPTIREI
ncbi:unannotated protein [freshwater metagenome]|uniref:Unannotated protein n=1 Tax=freshwater metagenome TaxID=449393 RepID=A0A6J7D2C9_9ZZZZ